MLRKTLLALAACATIGGAALAPTSASAYWHNGWYGGYAYRPAIRVYAGPVYGSCMTRRWFYTPAGPVLRWVNRCY